MPLLIIALGVLLLLIMIMGLKLNTFVSLIIVSFIVALLLGMPMSEVVGSIESGLGGTLGHIALIFGMGAMLGRLIADAGGANRIATTLIDKFGEKRIQWAVLFASFIVGIALFLEVTIVLLIPIIFSIAKELKVSIVHLGLPMVTAALATHAFLPPHPGPTAVAAEYGANIGLMLIYGIIVAIPTVILAGILYPKLAKKIVPSAWTREGSESFGVAKTFKEEEMPSFGISVFTALFPVILMAIGAAVDILQKSLEFDNNMLIEIIRFVGNSSTAMVISLLVAIYTMGIRRNIPIKKLMDSCGSAINALGMLLLIIGGGGALKQVLIDGGVGDYVASIFADTSMSPVFFAWMVAAILRICLGSGTVATLTTAGLVIPSLGTMPDVNLELVALATGAGSAIASHVNDAGFWMVKESLGMTLKEAFGTYTVLSTVVAVSGLVFTMILDIFI
ncbi:gluconate:H+ symporter [Terribacillus saccharophilus]|uniref:Gluconate permease n=1 Tax=Terribacillus saccharophilus TaxID=361277 RepID=A0A268A6X0_9BACI|nr:gluconate:H+ symporter [Terribacillus saccharophilus]PAD19870.1 gluconate permease [Terribacillus saccharophilus]PAF19199.1 gluconate permease [Terribacillus saccharophilus]PAF23016.1 gluconate permease [Terribacillus saccharophilus]PAF36697.1 gluconate permease [Terribacillus saccharophilus]PAF40389.1 gluconate permease [Terribacillus saccharophilus]